MRRGRIALLSLVALGASAGIGVPSAGAANPSILNTGTGCTGQTQWLISCATGGQTGTGGNANFLRTAGWVTHDAGSSLSSILTDDDWDGTVDPTTVRSAGATRPTIAGGYPRSRFNVSYQIPTANTGMSCSGFPTFGGTRRTDNRNARIAARDSVPQTSGTSSSQIKFVAAGSCTGPEDYAYLYNVASGNFGNTLTPGQGLTLTYNGDDSDTTGDSDFNGVFWRLRNIRTGATTTPQLDCDNNGDNAGKSTAVTFPDRGAWVVEAELRDGGGCGQQQNNGYWFALGSADVNSSGAPTGSLAADGDTGTAGIQRPQFNGNVAAQASSLSDPDSADGGGVQIIEWDLDENTGNGVDGYEDTTIGGYGSTLTGTQTKTINTTGQSPGLHTIRMRLTDNGAGDAADSIRRRSGAITTTYLVDSAPTANAQTVTATTNQSLPITLTGSDPDGDTLTYSITDAPDNGTLSGSGANRTYTPNPSFAGTDFFVFQVNDGFGRTANATVNINVEPDTTIDTPPSNPSNLHSGTIAFSSGATGASFECALDTPTFTNCSSPYTYTNLSDGPHTFQVRARAAFFTDQTPASTTWTIDATPPDTQIDPPTPADPTNQSDPTFNFSAPGEPTATFECRLDGDMPAGTGWQACTDPESYSGLADGSHTFEVRAVDALQNKDQSPATFTWTIDTVAPNVSIDAPTPPDPSNSADATFDYSSDESGDFACRLDTPAGVGTFQPCDSGTSGSQTYNGLTDGSHTFRVRQTDAAGNTSTEDTHTWVVDLTPPTVNLLTHPNAFTNQNSASFTYNGSEPGVTFQCRLDTPTATGSYQPCDTQPQTYSGLGDGEHTFYVKGTDVAGNEGPATDFIWTIDQTPPDTQIDPPTPADPSNSTMASFNYSSSEANSTFECKLDSGPFQPCNTQPQNYSSLGQGSHTFQVQATDSAGNTDPTPATFTWVVDTVAPATAIDDLTAPGNGNANHRTTSPDANFDFFSNDGTASFECRLDPTGPGGWGPCTSPQAYTGLTDGPHRFEVRAKDPAGNVDPTPAFWDWEIYSGLPNTTIDDFPPNPTNSTSAHFEFSSSIPDSTFECTLDGSAPAPCDSPEDFTNLDPGSHTFTVVATDEFGRPDPSPATYTWVIDLTAPDTTITAQPADPTNIDDASFQFESNEPSGATFECRLDGDAPGGTGWVPCGDPSLQQDYTDLPDGSHTFEVRATDAAGNADQSPASYTWVIDTDEPETTIDDQPDDPSNVVSPAFEFSSDEDPDATFQCKLDTPAGTGTFGPCSSPQQYSNLVQGQHTFSVYAIDAAGNVDQTPDTYTWTVDLTAPETTIDPPTPDDPTNDTSPEFNFSSDDPGATFECRLDSTDPGDFLPCGTGDTFNTPEGSHTFEVRAIDEAGNVDQTPDSFSWTVDTTDPQTTITAAPDNPTSQTGASFSFTSDSSPATFECRIDSTDDNDWQSCVSGQSYSGLTANTTHTFEVRATDEADNTDDAPASHTWAIDTDEPDTTITPPTPADPTNQTSASFTYTSDESPASFECRLDSTMESDFQPCNTQPRNYSSLGQGSHTFEVRAIDEAGNKDSTPASHTWVIDTAAPETTIDPPTPADPTNSDDPTFNFSSELGATFECRLDGDTPTGTGWVPCNSPQSYVDVDPGTHTFEVRATDTAANTDPTPASFTWEIDQDEPETTITDGPDDPTNSQSAAFDFNSDEPTSTFECSIDGAAFTSCSTGQSYTGLGEGTHTFAVQATDEAGNTDSTPDEYEWEIDLTAPGATIDTNPPDPSNSNSADFTFSSTDTGATFECRLDGDPPGGTGWEPCTSPEGYSGLADGSHTFEVRATDTAGNTGAADNHTWEIDTAPPTVDITSGPDDPTNSTSASIAFNTAGSPATTECDIDGGGFSACTSPQSYTGLTEGSHTITVEVTDAAGNSSTDEHTWEIDLTAPIASITNQPPAQSNSSSAGFDFGSDSSGSTFECRLDGDPPGGTGWEPCTSPQGYSGLGEGSHAFEVRATDPAGNTGAADDYTWNVDTVAPAPTITGGPSGPTSQASATFDYDPGEPGLTEECRLDGGAFGPCSSPKAYTGLPDGPHVFVVRVTDAAGNSGTATRNWTIDTGVPDTTITAGPAASTSATDANLSFTSTESGSTFECKLDAGAFVSCASPQAYTGLPVGNHTFEVRATDAVGNVDPSPAARSWTVTAPQSGVLGAGPPVIKKRVRALNVPTEAAFQIATITCRAGTCTITEKTATFKIGGRTYKGSISVEVVAKSSVDSLTKGEVAQVIVHFPIEVRRSLVANHTGVLSVQLAAQTDAGSSAASKRIKIKAKYLKKLFG